MTRKSKSPKSAATRRREDHSHSERWLLQDAKARFSELVRRVRTDGPQLVTVHGREAVVVVSAEEFRRLKRNPTGKALVEVMQTSPLRDVDIEPRRGPLPVRDVTL
jgi:prevent-host-death family protein